MANPWERNWAKPANTSTQGKPWERNWAKPVAEPQGGNSIFSALAGGTQNTMGAIRNTFNIYTGDSADILDQATSQPQRTADQDAFAAEIKRRVGENDDGWLQGLQSVVGAAWSQPVGALHEMAAQLPNMGVALAGFAAGAQVGGAIGTVVPGVGNAIGAITGGILGMFVGNTALETGFRAGELASDGAMTPEEMSQAGRQGAIKGGVITAVDAATLGLSRAFAGAPGRAVEKAVTSVLKNRGIDVANNVAAKAALATPEILSDVVTAGAGALARTMTKAQRLTRGGVQFSMESVGEGAGEYLGSTAAGLEASPSDAILEALMSVPFSAVEMGIAGSSLEKGNLTKQAESALGREISVRDVVNRIAGAPSVDSALREAARMTETNPQDMPVPFSDAPFAPEQPEARIPGIEIPSATATLDELAAMQDKDLRIPTLTDQVDTTGATVVRDSDIPTLTDRLDIPTLTDRVDIPTLTDVVDVTGEPAELASTPEWKSFGPETGTLQVPRAEMPQIKAEHRGAMTQYLKGQGLSHTMETVPANTLKPSQAEYSPAKVRQALDYQGGDRSILVSSDNYIIDGHHQWLAKQDQDIGVIRINAPFSDVLEVVKGFPSAESAEGAADSLLGEKLGDATEAVAAAPAESALPLPTVEEIPTEQITALPQGDTPVVQNITSEQDAQRSNQFVSYQQWIDSTPAEKLKSSTGILKEIEVDERLTDTEIELLTTSFNTKAGLAVGGAQGAPTKGKGGGKRDDSLLVAIAKLGGINTDYRLDLTGDAKNIFNQGGQAFTKKGMHPADMVRALIVEGYFTEADRLNPNDNDAVNLLADRIKKELAGKKFYRLDSTKAADQAYEQYQEDQLEMEKADREREYDRIASEHGQEIADQARHFDEAMELYVQQNEEEITQLEQEQLNVYEIDQEFQGTDSPKISTSREQVRGAVDDKGVTPREGDSGTQEGQIGGGFALDQQTPEDIAKQERERAKAEAEKRDADAKAKADAELPSFTMTGSDSAVDRAEALGQQNMFDAAPSSSATPEPGLPKIITAKRENYIKQMVTAAKLKRGSPGYDDAVAAIEKQYDVDLNKAFAALPFERYNERNSDAPESLNRQAWEALREEYGDGAEAAGAAGEAQKKPEASESEKRWNSMSYSQRQDLVQVTNRHRPVVHRISGSKWAELSTGEQADMEAQMRKADAAQKEQPANDKLVEFSNQMEAALLVDKDLRINLYSITDQRAREEAVRQALTRFASSQRPTNPELWEYTHDRRDSEEYVATLTARLENILFKPAGPTWTAVTVQGALHSESVADASVIEAARKGMADHRAALTDKLMSGIEKGLKSSDAGEKAAFQQLLRDGNLDPSLFGPQYFDGAYKEALRLIDKAERQARREAWKTQSDEAIKDIQAEFSGNTEGFGAFLIGWNHALEGNTASNLPTSATPASQISQLKDGYNRGVAFIEENGGAPGKPRKQKMDRTGVILRRLQDNKTFNRDLTDDNQIKAEIERVVEKLLGLVSRSEAFPLLVADGATPGTTRAMEYVRDQYDTPRIALERWLQLTHSFRFWRTPVEQQLTRYVIHGKKAHSFGSTWPTSGGWQERIDEIAEQLQKYSEKAAKDAEMYSGVKTVAEVAFRYAKNAAPTVADADVPNLGTYYAVTRRYELGQNIESAAVDVKQMRRPRFDRIVREGMKDHRGGRDIPLAELKNTFGLADIHPGNYVTAQQLQDHSNYAYDAFMDMAELLGWKPSQIGFGGKLHLAFGALGRGRHAAHYQDGQPVLDKDGAPTGERVAVINLTNTKGDGTVAHEYFHAIDFMIRRAVNSGEMLDATHQAVTLLRYQAKPAERIMNFAQQFLTGGWTWQNSKSMGKVESAKYGLKRAMDALVWLSRGAQRADLKHAADHTRYHSNAMALGKDYWGNNEEMLARAGEAWAYDKLQAKKADNTYLVSEWVKADGVTKEKGYKGTPYPTEVEREYINSIVELFVQHIKIRADGMPTIGKEFMDAVDEQIINPTKAAVQQALDSLPKDDAELAAQESAKKAEADRLREEQAALEMQQLRDQLEQSPKPTPEALEGVSDEDIDAAFDAAMDELESAEQETLPDDNKTGHTKLVEAILNRGFGTKMDWRELFKLADFAFGGTQADGTYTPKDAYDAVEIALNREILDGNYVADPSKAMDQLEALIDNLPTQSKRTEEQDEYQQFSTPPTIAYLMARAANLNGNDILLEPSAGTGNLAVMAVADTDLQALILNEYSSRRAALLEGLPFGVPASTYREDASHLSDILPASERPTVVLMNPPFSADAGKNKGKRTNDVGMTHVEQALARLEPGGRLVALVGQGLAANLPQARKFWADIRKNYTVRANIGLSGESYRKFGTTFDNQLLVIDKIGPQQDSVKTITDEFKGPDALGNLKAALTSLEGVINARVNPGEQFTNQSGGQTQAGRGSHSRIAVPTSTGGKGAGGAGESTTGAGDNGNAGESAGNGAGNRNGNAGRGKSSGRGRSGRRPSANTNTAASGGNAGRPLSDILSDAAGTAFAGSSDALKGLVELFGGNAIKSFPAGFDAETYAKAKPYFQKAWDNYKQTGKSLKEFFMELGRLLGVAITKTMKPYAIQFVKEMREGDTSESLSDKTTSDLPDSNEQFDTLEQKKDVGEKSELTDSIFDNYHPEVTLPGAAPHPGALVESSAMAAVKGPPTNYIPSLAKEIVREGRLSDAQIEQVIRAGAAHERVAADGKRLGYFVGDGTGVGKAREIIGIMLDNIGKGRKKHIWISKDANKLYQQALKDWKSVTGKDGSNVIHLVPSDSAKDIDVKEGIIFMSYGQLKAEAEKKRSRLEQMKQWMGKEFDGVIAFDEAHKMGKSLAVKGARGPSTVSQTAQAGMDLQDVADNARMLYVSATGATEISNFGYMKRLGLWGEGTSFSTVNDFVSKVGSKGLAMMELVAQNMKSLGVYLARSLSFHDVSYDTLTHNFSEDDTTMYNVIANAWQTVFSNMEAALELTGATEDGAKTKGNKAKQFATTAFWGAQQRFFNQLLTSMQMPTLLDDIEKQLKNGEAVVLQLVNTNEAAAERAATKAAQEETDLDDLDMTPRQIIMQFVEKSFPVVKYEQVTDADGNVRSEIVRDSSGEPVVSAEAVAMREEMLDMLAEVPFPDGALDQIINRFGSGAVAEVTGRKRRLIDGKKGKEWEKRSKGSVTADIADFQNDKKKILVFSSAGATGVDFHADLRVNNQRKRNHYLVQAGWRADEAVQGFGRTHRSNQKQAPRYILVTTDLKGHRRFISSVARRLDQLGALTKGQRETGSQGIFSADFNLETSYASEALAALIKDVFSGAVDGVTQQTMEVGMGLALKGADGSLKSTPPSIQQFLNRLLALKVDDQGRVFDAFFQRMEDIIAYHKETGDYDSGIENIKGIGIQLVSEQEVYKHASTGAKTAYVKLSVESPLELTTFSQILDIAEARGKLSQTVFAKNKNSGRIYAFMPMADKTTKEGKVVPQLRRFGPSSISSVEKFSVLRGYRGGEAVVQDNFQLLSAAEAAGEWGFELAMLPQSVSQDVHLITGAVLPIYDRLPYGSSVRVVRAQTDDGRRFIGLRLNDDDVATTLKALGAEQSIKETPAQLMDAVLINNKRIKLANGWTIKRALVSGDPRIELDEKGDGFRWGDKFASMGIIKERINSAMRYFIPVGDLGVFERLLRQSPATDIISSKDDGPLLRVGDTTPGRGMSAAMVSASINPILETWKSGPQIVVVPSTNQLPDRLRSHAYQQAGGIVSGVYDQESGRIYLVAEHIRTPEQARITLAHEAIGHYAFLREYRNDLATIFGQVLQLANTDAAVGKIVDRVRKEYAGQSDDVIAAETISAIAEGGIKGGILLKIRSMVIGWLRKLGFNIEFTANELHGMLRSAADSLRKAPRNETPTSLPPLSAVSPNKPVFVSAALNAARAMKQAKGTPQQMVNMLAKTPGVKADELEWLGIKEYTESLGDTVTKQQLVDFIAANGVQVEDVVLGDPENTTYDIAEWWNDEGGANEETPFDELSESEKDEARLRYMNEVEQYTDESLATQYTDYQTPGGENYRELLLTLPRTERTLSEIERDLGFTPPLTNEQQDAVVAQWKQHSKDDKDFRSSHFNQSNILAHVRFNERTDADGNRVLFIEEMQSDWAQKGRSVGFKNKKGGGNRNIADIQADKIRLAQERDAVLRQAAALPDSEMTEFRRLMAQEAELSAQQDRVWREFNDSTTRGVAVPDTPFKTTKAWTTLALKRMVRWAADNGFDKIAWTTGEQQVARYPSMSEKNKAGLRAFYNDVLPATINKFAERFGASVGKTKIPQLADGDSVHVVNVDSGVYEVRNDYERVFGIFSTWEQAEEMAWAIADGIEHTSLTITPAMREAALQGFPLFRVATETESDYAKENARIREEDKTLWDRIKQEMRRQLTPAGLLPDSVFHSKIARDNKLQVVEFDIAHRIGELERAIRADYKVRADQLSDADMAALADAIAGNMPPSLGEATRHAVISMRQYIDDQSEQYVQILREQTEGMVKGMDAGEQRIVQAFLEAGEIEAASDSRADKASATSQRNAILDEAREEAKAIWGDGKKMQAALASAATVAEKVRLMNTITSNAGSYVHRSYQAFDDENWYSKVPDKVLDEARAYLVSRMMERAEERGEALSVEEAEAEANDTMDIILKDGTAYDNLESFIKESKLGAKDLSVLIKRKRIAPQIRALLGEYKDPRINFAKTATKMGRLIWNQRFLDRVLEVGKGVFLFDKQTAGTTLIAADGSEVYSPLNGLYAPREIVQAFKDALGKERLEGMYKWMVQANGAVKFGKTILSPTTTLRNWQSAMLFTLANGHFDLTQIRKSVDGLKEYFTHSGEGVKLAYLRKLKDLGVVYDTAYAGEMMKLLSDFQSDTLVGFGPDSMLRNSVEFAKKAYSYGDDFWKIVGFENEKNMLIKHAGMTEAQAEVEAAERIRNTYPTYSMVGLGIQKLRRFPLVGTFVSFPAEIIRTTFNMLGYVAKDLKTPGMRPLALRRIAGLAIAAGFAHALQELLKHLFDVDDDDEEAVRLQAAPWQQNSNLLFIGRDDGGNLKYIDISFLDPYNYWKRPINAMLRDQPWEDEAISAAQDLLTPFFGTDILAGTLMEVYSNKKDTGGEVYKSVEPVINQALDIANHIRKDIQPGIMTNLERTWRALDGQLNPQGQKYEMGDELAAWVGWRATTLDTKAALRYHTFDFKDAKADATSVLAQVLKSPNKVDAADIVDAYEMAQSIRDQAYEDMIKMVGAAQRSGLSVVEIRMVLKANDVSDADIGAVMAGRIPEWAPSQQSETAAVREAAALLGPEKALEIRQRYRLARQEAIRRMGASGGTQ